MPRRVALVGAESTARMLANVWSALDETPVHEVDLYEPFVRALRGLYPLEAPVKLEDVVRALGQVAPPNPHHLHLTDPLPRVVWGVRTHDDVEFLRRRGYTIVFAGGDLGELYADEIDRRVEASTPQEAVLEIVRWAST